MLILPTKQIIHINSFNFNGKIIYMFRGI